MDQMTLVCASFLFLYNLFGFPIICERVYDCDVLRVMT